MLEMILDNLGEWVIVCRINDYYLVGMFVKYNVDVCGKLLIIMLFGNVCCYYIVVVELEWDYVFSGRDFMDDILFSESELV